MKRQSILLTLVIALLFASKALADNLSGYFSTGGNVPITTATPLQVATPAEPTGLAQASISSINANVPNTSTTVTLTAASTVIDIWTSIDAAPLHIDWTNTGATTNNAAIQPGATYRMVTRNSSGITAFKVIGDSATGTFNVMAN